MNVRVLLDLYNFVWMLESHSQQRLAWDDAVQARHARMRAEAQAAQQLRAMLDANPSGQLGNTQLDDWEALVRSGLL